MWFVLVVIVASGDASSAVSIPVLARAVDRHHVGYTDGRHHGQHKGPVLVGRSLADRHAPEMMVVDPCKKTGHLPKLNLRTQCFREHPGFCVKKHAAFAFEVKRITANLNNAFRGSRAHRHELLGTVWRFRIMCTSGDAWDMFEALSDLRYARPVVQMFCECEADIDDANPNDAFLITAQRKTQNSREREWRRHSFLSTTGAFWSSRMQSSPRH